MIYWSFENEIQLGKFVLHENSTILQCLQLAHREMDAQIANLICSQNCVDTKKHLHLQKQLDHITDLIEMEEKNCI